MPGANFDAEHIAEPLGRGDEQLLAVGDDFAEIIGQAAVGERDIAAALEDDDFRLLVHPPQPRRTRSPARHAADDQNAF